jgi:DNA invertase Pin-like site-specific DNA recombinase
VRSYLNGGRWRLVGAFTEVESGRKNDRPQLARALNECRRKRARLIIAKLDRLARNVAFISNLMESGVDFVAVDFPQANRLTVHVLAAVAEHEAAMVSARTKAALAAAKARGVKLGGHHPQTLSDTGRALGRASQSRRAAEHAALSLPVIEDLRSEGAVSLRELANGLTERGIPTVRGCATWTAAGVSRVLPATRIKSDQCCRQCE